MEQDEEDEDTEDKREGAKNDEVEEDEVKIPPDYYESSEEEDAGVSRTVATCQCSGSGSCNFCKKMRGCTCEGAGTCRLCELEQRKEEEESDDDIEIIEEPRPPPATSQEMSTTEYFLMTGKVRPPSQEAEEDDIQVLEPQVPPTLTTRGRGRGRGRPRGRAPGGRGGPVNVPLQRPLRPPIYRDSLALAPREGFVQNQMRPVRLVRPPAVRGGQRSVRSRGGAAQYSYRSPAPPQQRFLVAPARPVRPVRPPTVQYNYQTRPARPARPARLAVPLGRRTVSFPPPPGQYRDERPVVTNLESAYYDRANQRHSEVGAEYYDSITQHEVVDLSDDEDEQEAAALISRLPSGIRISKI